MYLKMKRKQMSGSRFESKDVKNHGSAWSLVNSTTLSEKTYWYIVLRYQLWLLPVLEIVLYIYIYKYMICECTHVHTHIHTHTHFPTHTLWNIPVSWAKVNYAPLDVYIFFFYSRNLIVFLIMYTFFRCICKRFQSGL